MATKSATPKTSAKKESEIPTSANVASKPRNPLMRSETNRILGGVAGGLGTYLDLDAGLVRLIFILMTVFGGSGILIYLLLWFVIPSDSDDQKTPDGHLKNNVEEIKQKAYAIGYNVRTATQEKDSKSWGAFVLIGLGVLFLLQNYGWMHGVRFDKLWPLFLVGLGFVLLFRK